MKTKPLVLKLNASDRSRMEEICRIGRIPRGAMLKIMQRSVFESEEREFWYTGYVYPSRAAALKAVESIFAKESWAFFELRYRTRKDVKTEAFVNPAIHGPNRKEAELRARMVNGRAA